MSPPTFFSVGGFRLCACRAASLAWLAFVFPAANPARAADGEGFKFHHEAVLGTSLDLQVNTADAQQAALVETTILAEIERLRKILSSYDPASEISRVNGSTTPVVCSQE